MAVAANRGELTVEVVAAADFAWFNAQLAERHYLGAGRPVGDYLRQVVRVRGTPAALLTKELAPFSETWPQAEPALLRPAKRVYWRWPRSTFFMPAVALCFRSVPSCRCRRGRACRSREWPRRRR
jgi:hypothetical protein